MIRCTVGVFAHNEAQNVRRALYALLAQQLHEVEIVEIIVIASGCTDGTVEVAEEVASRHDIVSVDVETTRKGKAAAIKRLTSMARGEIVVLVGADTLLSPTAIEHLLQPFKDRHIGMTGARVIPLNTPNNWLGFSVQMLWHVHHQLALRNPKLGELVAFRNVVDVPEDTSTDEPAIEALITAKGYRLFYAPKAVVYNRGPENIQDFMRQRRRVFAGQARVAFRFGYRTSSLVVRNMFPVIVEAIWSHPRFFLWTLATMGIELWARVQGMFDAMRGREDVVWRAITTTKAVVKAPETSDLTLISVRWAPGGLDSVAFLRDLRRLPDPVGSVFWWDWQHGEALLKVHAPVDRIQTHIRSISREHVLVFQENPGWPSISYQVVKFNSSSRALAN
jgi:poly-beta-1,6-N-acetyl-D-glucosamine synthase